MAETKRKGDIGELKIMADILERGYKVAIPYGDDWQYDLLVVRKGKFEKVQCKYTESKGEIVKVRCKSSNNWSVIKYTSKMVDWIAVYDIITDKCYYVPSSLLGDGRVSINLRLSAPKNNQVNNILWAKDFLEF